MPDLETTGNVAQGLLLLGSVAVWGWIIVRRLRGEAAVPWQPREACPWHAVAVGLALPVSIVVTQLTMFAGPVQDETGVERLQSLCLAHGLEMLVLMGLLAVWAPIRGEDFGLRRPGWGRDVLIGLAGFLASLLPVYSIVQLIEILNPFLKWKEEGARHDLFLILDAHPEPSTVAWVALAVVVLAPLAEELLYRVVLQGWLESRLSPRAAILFVALLFAWVHYRPGRPDHLPLFPLAVILGYVYHRRHSYPAVVALHAAFNAVNLTFAILFRGEAL